MYPCSIKYKGVEHCHQYAKCKTFILNVEAGQILQAPSAQKANAAVKHDADSQIWQTYSLEIMANILLTKVISYASFGDALSSSENSILVKATQDLFWGRVQYH